MTGDWRLPPRPDFTVPIPGRAPLRLGPRCLVMGILNVTPDSFAEQSHFDDPEAAVEAALEMEAAGADLIDVGGESTRPDAAPVPSSVEIARVVPVLDRLAGRLTVPISVDTSKADVARAACQAGASVVNDVSGLQADRAMAKTVADCGAALVLMHSRGTPRTMAAAAVYEDLLREVVSELRLAVERAAGAGVEADRIIVDPGIGFAKRPSHSYGVLAHLAEAGAALHRPVLVGPSRKSFLSAALAARPPVERDWGTAAAVAAAVFAGAHIVRVHAVREMVQVVSVAEEIRRPHR